jgi:hypothetical protein
VEARIPFEIVSSHNITREELERFRVLVLPSADRLSDDECATIRAFAAAGGSVVAAFESSLADSMGVHRGNFGLADVFGADLVRPARGPVKNNYIAITGAHPLTAGFDGAGRIIGGTELIEVAARPGTHVPFRFVPDFPDLPMEEVYPRAEPNVPAVVAQELDGGGRSVYLPFNIGSLFWETLQQDHATLIANAVRWALGRPERVTVSGPGLVDLSVWESAGALAVALVNLTNPMAMRGHIRETVPVGPMEVSFAAPTASPGGIPYARLLVSGAEVPVRHDGDRLVCTVPSIDLLEVVHLEWGNDVGAPAVSPS